VLVLEAGTSAAAALLSCRSPSRCSKTRRSKAGRCGRSNAGKNFLENQKELTKYKEGGVSASDFFNYYLGYLANPSITDHYLPVPESRVEFAKEWGMKRRRRRSESRDRKKPGASVAKVVLGRGHFAGRLRS